MAEETSDETRPKYPIFWAEIIKQLLTLGEPQLAKTLNTDEAEIQSYIEHLRKHRQVTLGRDGKYRRSRKWGTPEVIFEFHYNWMFSSSFAGEYATNFWLSILAATVSYGTNSQTPTVVDGDWINEVTGQVVSEPELVIQKLREENLVDGNSLNVEACNALLKSWQTITDVHNIDFSTLPPEWANGVPQYILAVAEIMWLRDTTFETALNISPAAGLTIRKLIGLRSNSCHIHGPTAIVEFEESAKAVINYKRGTLQWMNPESLSIGVHPTKFALAMVTVARSGERGNNLTKAWLGKTTDVKGTYLPPVYAELQKQGYLGPNGEVLLTEQLLSSRLGLELPAQQLPANLSMASQAATAFARKYPNANLSALHTAVLDLATAAGGFPNTREKINGRPSVEKSPDFKEVVEHQNLFASKVPELVAGGYQFDRESLLELGLTEIGALQALNAADQSAKARTP